MARKAKNPAMACAAPVCRKMADIYKFVSVLLVRDVVELAFVPFKRVESVDVSGMGVSLAVEPDVEFVPTVDELFTDDIVVCFQT